MNGNKESTVSRIDSNDASFPSRLYFANIYVNSDRIMIERNCHSSDIDPLRTNLSYQSSSTSQSPKSLSRCRVSASAFFLGTAFGERDTRYNGARMEQNGEPRGSGRDAARARSAEGKAPRPVETKAPTAENRGNTVGSEKTHGCVRAATCVHVRVRACVRVHLCARCKAIGEAWRDLCTAERSLVAQER